jgi:hypothetical protein
MNEYDKIIKIGLMAVPPKPKLIKIDSWIIWKLKQLKVFKHG